MAIFSQRQTEPVDRYRSLAGIPIVSANTAIAPDEQGNMVMSIKLPSRRDGILARFRPAVVTRRIKLDELGTFVVGQIDGTRTVLDIIEAFVTTYKVNRREAELSIVAFLKSLIKRHVVSIAIE